MKKHFLFGSYYKTKDRTNVVFCTISAFVSVLFIASWHTVFQPLFKALSKVWYGLEEEAEQLKILHNIMLNLQPFKASQAKLFPADYLDGLLKDSEVKADEKRAMESSGIG